MKPAVIKAWATAQYPPNMVRDLYSVLSKRVWLKLPSCFYAFYTDDVIAKLRKRFKRDKELLAALATIKILRPAPMIGVDPMWGSEGTFSFGAHIGGGVVHNPAQLLYGGARSGGKSYAAAKAAAMHKRKRGSA